jgi:tetratricopeptide (TPR) repeat protein
MSRSLLILSSILMLAAGCRHGQVPDLPASHGHLSRALHKYLDLPGSVPSAASIDSPSVVIEPAQAPALFAEAVEILKRKPTEEEVRQASDDLTGACEAPFPPACDFLRQQFTAPEKLEGGLPKYPPEAIAARAFAFAVIRCRLGVDGRFRACEVLEIAPYGFTQAVIEELKGRRYRPALLAGHPIEISYLVIARMAAAGAKLTPEQELQWARMRTERFLESTPAWLDLATLLAERAPEDPAYPQALQRLNQLSPKYWWPASELAWMHVQEGRYAEAAPLIQRARMVAPLNAYVLETSAATLMGQGNCAEAIAEQRRAVEGLPWQWPKPERERFERTLREYAQRCTEATPASGTHGTAP